MADPKVVIEGEAKHRDGKKWKSRWCVLTKLSPVADCLHLQLYKNSADRCKHGPTKASLSLEGYLAMETAFTLDKESNTLALICHDMDVILAFDSRETLIQWQVHVRNHLPEVQQFLVQVTHIPPKSRLSCGPARLHLQNKRFSLVTGIPAKLAGHWQIPHLRKFGIVDGRFCFEGGSQCGKGEGLHVLHTNQMDELVKAFELSACGRLCDKRKPMRRIHNSDSCTCWMSSQGFCSHRHHGSDSGRRLPSSDSDGSASEISAEILRYCSPRNEVSGSEDTTSTRSTCFTSLRWSSSASESVVGYVSSNSLPDTESHCSAPPSLQRQQLIPPCENPFLQNYAVPRKSSLSECKSTCSSINTLCCSRGGILQSDETSERRFSPDILSFHLAKDLDLSCDETNSGSSSDSTFASNLRSSCSTCSSTGSGPSVFMSFPGTNCQSSSTCSNSDHACRNSSGSSHYQVPRPALTSVCFKEGEFVEAGRGHRPNPCSQSLMMSKTGEFYDVPKNLNAGSFSRLT